MSWFVRISFVLLPVAVWVPAHEPAVAQESPPVWSLSEVPLTSIGSRTGDPNHELYQVVGATRLGTGVVVVANSGSSELRFYNSAGDFIRAVGGRGGGPGEFQRLRHLIRTAGDTLLTFDPQNGNRVTFFSQAGDLVRTMRIPVIDDRTADRVVGAFSDGTLLVQYSYPTTNRPSPIVRRFPMTNVRISPDGTVLDTMGTVLSAELFLQEVPPQFGGTAYWNRIFGVHGIVRVVNDVVYTADGSRYGVVRYDDAGVGTHMGGLRQRRLVTREDISLLRKRSLDRARGAAVSLTRRMLDAMPYPDSLPALSNFLVDPLGRAWIVDYLAPKDTSQHFTVVSDTGPVGAVELPVGFDLFEVGVDYVLGLWRDAFEVEHVQVFRVAS